MNQLSETASRFANWRTQKMSKPETAASPGAGHNSKALIEEYTRRLETLELEKRSFADDIRELCSEAKGKGVDPKALKAIVRRKLMTAEQRDALREHQETVDNYAAALGMLD